MWMRVETTTMGECGWTRMRSVTPTASMLRRSLMVTIGGMISVPSDRKYLNIGWLVSRYWPSMRPIGVAVYVHAPTDPPGTVASSWKMYTLVDGTNDAYAWRRIGPVPL